MSKLGCSLSFCGIQSGQKNKDSWKNNKFTLSSDHGGSPPEYQSQSIPGSRSHTHLHGPCDVARESRSCRKSPAGNILEQQGLDLDVPQSTSSTITRITTHGKFKDLTISIATELLPEPELPAMPIMLKSCHGGEYRTSVGKEYKGEIDSMAMYATYNAVGSFPSPPL